MGIMLPYINKFLMIRFALFLMVVVVCSRPHRIQGFLQLQLPRHTTTTNNNNNIHHCCDDNDDDGQQHPSSLSSLPPPLPTTTTTRGDDDSKRRQLIASLLPVSVAMISSAATAAAAEKSRTQGYAVQKTDAEWKSQLSELQYYVLRQGGTERPNYSILEAEERPGIYYCAGCEADGRISTALFDARDKFHSGTGWPSFARAIQGGGVEIESVSPVAANLLGAELRCANCGGHLGDVFQDGFLFVGTPAFVTGKRFCIDGAALVFYPASSSSSSDNDTTAVVRGDRTSNKRGSGSTSSTELPSWLEPPTITPQSS